MVFYLVKAKPRKVRMKNLRQELDSGNIAKLKPFGEELHHGLDSARTDDSYAYWVEEDYCSPPLAMEWQACLTSILMKLRLIRSIQKSRAGAE
jgi:hypothetical protein